MKLPIDAMGLTRAIREGIVPHPRSPNISVAELIKFAGLPPLQRVERVTAYETEDQFVVAVHYYEENPRVLELSFNNNTKTLYWAYWSRQNPNEDMVECRSGTRRVEYLREQEFKAYNLAVDLAVRGEIERRVPPKVRPTPAMAKDGV